MWFIYRLARHQRPELVVNGGRKALKDAKAVAEKDLQQDNIASGFDAALDWGKLHPSAYRADVTFPGQPGKGLEETLRITGYIVVETNIHDPPSRTR